VAMLKRSAIRPPCDQCGRAFDPTYGGVCRSCRRLLCPDHLYGSVWQRLRGLLGFTVSYSRCRAEAHGAHFTR